MYRSRFWTMRQYAGFSTAEESNKRYRYLLGQGQTGLSVAFDLPTQIGYDADDPHRTRGSGQGGRFDFVHSRYGAAVRSDPAGEGLDLDDHERARRDFAGHVHRRGKEAGRGHPKAARHHPKRHPEGIHCARHVYLPAHAFDETDHGYLFILCAGSSVLEYDLDSGYHIREAGSTAVQEVAFTLANGIAYVEAALKAGLAVDDFAGQLSFFFNAHNNLLEEVAKFRAARRMWARSCVNVSKRRNLPVGSCVSIHRPQAPR